ncbi:TIGR03643 family protein [Flavobacterium lindanitolerans]|uniref:TIGR03643 family protein n=1 Tax=Flavobacterium lindanitolerans TaxID=428988 RepID=UPI00352B8F8C
MVKKKLNTFNDRDLDRIIEMAWEDRTPFEAITLQFGLTEGELRKLMHKVLRPSSYRNWRSRIEQCKTKHASRRFQGITRFKCSRQRIITNNKISKR